jgi:hypothetical protein
MIQHLGCSDQLVLAAEDATAEFELGAVCDNAAEFLAATYRQPLLAVSAVAPGLYARVPTLARAHGLRLKAARALAAARGAGPAPAAKVSPGGIVCCQ